MTDFTSWWLKPWSHSSKKPNLWVLTLYTVTSRKILNFEEMPSVDTVQFWWPVKASLFRCIPCVWWGTETDVLLLTVLWCFLLGVTSLPITAVSPRLRSPSSPRMCACCRAPPYHQTLWHLCLSLKWITAKLLAISGEVTFVCDSYSLPTGHDLLGW